MTEIAGQIMVIDGQPVAVDPKDRAVYSMVVCVSGVGEDAKSVTLCCRTLEDAWHRFDLGLKGYSALLYAAVPGLMARKLISGLELALEQLDSA